jgi:hypothetical protein
MPAQAGLPTGSQPLRSEYVQISTIEEAYEFFGPLSSEQRQWRSARYFDPLLKSARAKLGVGEHDRAEAYIFGCGPYPTLDSSAHRSHFPVSVKVLYATQMTLAPGETLDLTAVPTEFPWDIHDQEPYLLLNVQRLQFGRHSTLRVNGNVFILKCEEALADGLHDGYATIQVGASNAVQQRSFQRTGLAPRTLLHGADGCAGADGPPPTVESTPLGVKAVADGQPRAGGAGSDGSGGSNGLPGRNGAMLFLTDLRFARLSGFGHHGLHLQAQAGAGFDGTPGGNGGQGGPGGAGSDGLVTAFGVVPAHEGGPGGRGGAGGAGGKGGNGGLSCDLFVSVPEHDASAFLPQTLPSQGGRGGAGGKGGKGGTGGPSGWITALACDAAHGPVGADGPDGHDGRSGKSRDAPRVHIFTHT